MLDEEKMSKIKITQVYSVIDRPKSQKLTIEALGLGRPNWSVIHNDTPQIRGMVAKVSHLVKVENYKEKKLGF
jgi:large subunit ribosomal protein L30